MAIDHGCSSLDTVMLLSSRRMERRKKEEQRHGEEMSKFSKPQSRGRHVDQILLRQAHTIP